ncbi:MAG: PAS domain S-box protein [Nitrospirales bacterium]|nr:PAS domain S-box protein [Nitrospirales bacterium]
MPTPSTQHPAETKTLGRRFAIVTVMFLTVLLGMLFYTTAIIKNEESNAVLIDLAGRQRMLLQRHFNEVMLTTQGVSADYTATRQLIRSTLTALIEGERLTPPFDGGRNQHIPEVPTNTIANTLREQQTAFQAFIDKTEDFIALKPTHPDYGPALEDLRDQNTELVKIADQAVKQIDRYSEQNISSMVKWESVIAMFVGLLGALVTVQGVRDGRRLEEEIVERERAETEVRQSELFLNSIIENIPNVVFVKRADTLQYVRCNRASELLTGYAREEILGKDDFEIHPEAIANLFVQQDREVLETCERVDISDEILPTKSLGKRHVSTKKIPLLDQDGAPQYVLGISEDITDRLQAEIALRESEERYRALYEDNPSMYFTVSQKGIILSVNKFGAQQLEYSASELVGQSVLNLFFEKDQVHVQEHFQACIQNPLTVFTWEFRKIRKHGDVIWVKEVARAVYDQEGDLVVLIVCEDISERKKTEGALQEWKALTQSVLEQLPKGFAYRCLNDKRWTVIYVSDGIEDITGVSASALLAGTTTYDTLMAPGENERVWPIIQEALAKRLPYENEHQIVTRDGKTKWILARGRFIFDESGELLYLDGLNVDITERKQIENQLRASEARFRSLIEHVPFCIHEIELNGMISSINQAGNQMMNPADGSVITGRSYLTLAEERDHQRMREYFAQAAQGQPVDFECHTTSHGHMKCFSKSFIPLRDGEGRIIKVIGISEDITERKLAEERLRESEEKRLEALKQSDALKSALLSSVSHELRTPLTAMKASVSNLLTNRSSNREGLQQEFLKEVDLEINYMSHLVDNLLDMSQIEAGTLTPRQEWHPLEDLVEGALRRTEVSTASQQINVQIPEDLPPVFVDAVEIQQVFINLLDNAMKYSLNGSPIHLMVAVENREITVKITNPAEPLDQQDLSRIFDRFYRRPVSRKQPIRGTGLGLAICKGIIEAHGGRIWAESNSYQVFITFTLPMTQSMGNFSLDGLHRSSES